jgi:hypothetical protein
MGGWFPAMISIMVEAYQFLERNVLLFLSLKKFMVHFTFKDGDKLIN